MAGLVHYGSRKKYASAYTLTEENARISGVVRFNTTYNGLKPSVISKSDTQKNP